MADASIALFACFGGNDKIGDLSYGGLTVKTRVAHFSS
jgi:hypothetical protein